jgi:hypothetical protein
MERERTAQNLFPFLAVDLLLLLAAFETDPIKVRSADFVIFKSSVVLKLIDQPLVRTSALDKGE